MKTGALLFAGVEMGAILGGASKAEHESLGKYGRALGVAFQIADDLLDEESDAATVGKATGKDAAMGKGTLVRLWGKDAARKRLGDLVTEAEAALAGFGDKAETLREAARFVANRERWPANRHSRVLMSSAIRVEVVSPPRSRVARPLPRFAEEG